MSVRQSVHTRSPRGTRRTSPAADSQSSSSSSSNIGTSPPKAAQTEVSQTGLKRREEAKEARRARRQGRTWAGFAALLFQRYKAARREFSVIYMLSIDMQDVAEMGVPLWVPHPASETSELRRSAAALPSLEAAVVLALQVQAEQWLMQRMLALYLQRFRDWEARLQRQKAATLNDPEVQELLQGVRMNTKEFLKYLSNRIEGDQSIQVTVGTNTREVSLSHIRSKLELFQRVLGQRDARGLPSRGSVVLDEALKASLTPAAAAEANAGSGSSSSSSSSTAGHRRSSNAMWLHPVFSVLGRTAARGGDDGSVMSSAAGNPGGEGGRWILEGLPFWMQEVGFCPSLATCRLLLRTFGSAALLEQLARGEAAGSGQAGAEEPVAAGVTAAMLGAAVQQLGISWAADPDLSQGLPLDPALGPPLPYTESMQRVAAAYDLAAAAGPGGAATVPCTRLLAAAIYTAMLGMELTPLTQRTLQWPQLGSGGKRADFMRDAAAAVLGSANVFDAQALLSPPLPAAGLGGSEAAGEQAERRLVRSMAAAALLDGAGCASGPADVELWIARAVELGADTELQLLAQLDTYFEKSSRWANRRRSRLAQVSRGADLRTFVADSMKAWVADQLLNLINAPDDPTDSPEGLWDDYWPISVSAPPDPAVDRALAQLLAAGSGEGERGAAVQLCLTRLERRMAHLERGLQSPEAPSSVEQHQAQHRVSLELLTPCVEALLLLEVDVQRRLLGRALAAARFCLPLSLGPLLTLLREVPEPWIQECPAAAVRVPWTYLSLPTAAAPKSRPLRAFQAAVRSTGDSLSADICTAIAEQLKLVPPHSPQPSPSDQLPQHMLPVFSLVQQCSRHSIALPVLLLEAVAEVAMVYAQQPQALSTLTILFSYKQLLSSPRVISASLLDCIVCSSTSASTSSSKSQESTSPGNGGAGPGALSPASVLAAAAPCSPRQLQLLHQGLLEASARNRCGSWALGLVQEAAQREEHKGGEGQEVAPGVLTPQVLSALVEAFIQPVVGRASRSSSSSHSSSLPRQQQQQQQQQQQHSHHEGIRAAELCFQYVASGVSPSVLTRELTPQCREALAAWFLSSSSSSSNSSPSPSAVGSFLPLALDLWPSAATARALLLHPGGVTAMELSRLLRLASEGQWAGVSRAAVAAVERLEQQQQTALSEGGAFALACLLVSDAAAASDSAPGEGGAAEQLDLLLGFLEEHVLGGAAEDAAEEGAEAAVSPSTSPSSSRVALTTPQWRQLFVMLLDLSDDSKTREAATAAERVVGMAQQAARVGVTGGGSSAGSLNRQLQEEALMMPWLMVQEALVKNRSLRSASCIALAQRLLQRLLQGEWALPVGTGRQGEGAGSRAVARSILGDIGGMEWQQGRGSEGRQEQVQAAVKGGVQLLRWISSKRAITDALPSALSSSPSSSRSGSLGSSSSAVPLLHWLPPLVAELCSSLAQVQAQWAVGLLGRQDEEAGLMTTAQACAAHGAHLALVDLVEAYKRNTSKNVPRRLAELSLVSMCDLELWGAGGQLLEGLGLGLQSWSSGRETTCDDILDKLRPEQARAVLSILINDTSTRDLQDSPSMVARSMSSMSRYCELQLLRSERVKAAGGSIGSNSSREGSLDEPSFDSPTLLMTLLAARKLAAAAALEHCQGQQGSRSKGSALDPAWHCQQAERLVQEEMQRQLSVSAAAGAAGVDAELLLALIDVFDAAARPVDAVRLSLQVASSQLPVSSSLGSDENSVIAAAMAVSNQGGFYKGTLMLLEELLVWKGEMSHGGVMSQAVAAVAAAPPAEQELLAQRILDAVGEEGYYSMEGCQVGQGQVCGKSVVKAMTKFLNTRRKMSSQERTAQWTRSLPLDWVVPDRDGSGLEDSNDEEEQQDPAEISGDHVVALLGGMEFKSSDEDMLRRIFPSSNILWFGSSRCVGQGNASEKGLVHQIKRGRVDLVLLQTKHNGHVANAKVMQACCTHGVQFHMVSTSVKAILKNQGFQSRDQAGL